MTCGRFPSWRQLAVVLLTASLTSCGGGGGGSSTPVVVATPTPTPTQTASSGNTPTGPNAATAFTCPSTDSSANAVARSTASRRQRRDAPVVRLADGATGVERGRLACGHLRFRRCERHRRNPGGCARAGHRRQRRPAVHIRALRQSHSRAVGPGRSDVDGRGAIAHRGRRPKASRRPVCAATRPPSRRRTSPTIHTSTGSP